LKEDFSLLRWRGIPVKTRFQPKIRRESEKERYVGAVGWHFYTCFSGVSWCSFGSENGFNTAFEGTGTKWQAGISFWKD